MLRYFPGGRRVVDDTFPPLARIERDFCRTGFKLCEVRQVSQVTARNLSALLERALIRADSTLAPLPEGEYLEGLNRLREAANSEPEGAVIDKMTLLVFV